QLQQRTFSSAVPSDDSDGITFLAFEIDITQRPNIIAVAFLATIVRLPDFELGIFLAAHFVPEAVQVVTQCSGTNFPQPVLFRNIFGFDGNLSHYTVSMKLR